MQSSYTKNNYKEIFHAIVTTFKPRVAVELGVLHGYSTLAIARALEENNRAGEYPCVLDSYDIFEDYPHNHAEKKEVQDRITLAGLDPYVKLIKLDASQAHEKYANDTVYFLHVDLSNTGDVLRSMIEIWHPKMILGGMILFEGGSEERDKVDWMIKYKKEPIKSELESNRIINTDYVYATYLKFPSLTILLKKRNDHE